MNLGYQEERHNGLSICVDWLSFTLKESKEPSEAFELLGYAREDFMLMPSGRYGYKSAYKHMMENVHILFDGNEGMGVHVDISGSSINNVIMQYHKKRCISTPFGDTAYLTYELDSTVFSDLCEDIRMSGGQFTRLDLAVDDIGAEYFTVKEIWELMETGCFSMRFKTFEHRDLRDASGNISGNTIYFGSRRSSCMLRVYDKKLEQNNKRNKNGVELLNEEWTRWEIELKDERADSAAQIIVNAKKLGDVVIGILANYIRFINIDSTRKTLCSNLDKWNAFISGITGLSLYQKPEPRTIDDKKAWIEKQVAPTLAAIAMADDGDMSFLYEVISNGAIRLNKAQYSMIALHQKRRLDIMYERG